ncbi:MULTISPECIES: deoxyribodipyrimidine photo-lyase [unclassified Acidovorax]|uniref:cryptochrome/photolyase family protein n=1 Tax=unclassified Acidovorax TaxID=2684926 RepID=UPI001C475E01|nr:MULTISPECIES: deoxyribodipyrimidine photo-lyase [unclassified Acidovorax]MBV7428129.1 DNA photolyase family protein [Acidovorax sp. sif0732]MBV7449386.1 DNA photolyase family protein [Acidovorax sp. sif0715]
MAHSPEPSYPSGLVWFRRDLRAHDQAALHHALTQCRQVHCLFVFDREILDALPRADRRVEFIREALVELDEALRALSGHAQGGLIVAHAAASESVPAFARALNVQGVFANHDDEPQALARDSLVRTRLAAMGKAFHTSKDHTILERSEVLTQSGTPYSVFTPYKNAWLKRIDAFQLKSYPVERHAHRLAPRPAEHCKPIPGLAALGFVPAAGTTAQPGLPTGASGARQLFDDFLGRIARYGATRDFPAVKGPSYLSVHLRFGTISPRLLAHAAHQLAAQGNPGAATWLNELIWRDFYFQILHHHPHVVGHAFKPAYDAIDWETGPHADALFAAWCAGRTGYPLVDAAMAQINQTGYMHNRLRMVVASFLVKDLGIDWRRGEAYFATHLNDFDLAANNGGWQWASSSGCDAQPYFRIFNPVSQSEKFDPQGKFIRRYLPQLAGLPDKALHAPWTARPLELQEAAVQLGQNYPLPIVDHAAARQRTLERYAMVTSAAA